MAKDKDKTETSITIRTTKIRKKEVETILDIINDKREPNKRKLTKKYLEEFFIESFKENPEFFSVKMELIEEKKKLRNYNEKLEYYNKLKANSEENIIRLEGILKNDSLDNYISDSSEGILLDSELGTALNHLVKLCKTKGIFSLEDRNKDFKTFEPLVTASLNVVEGKVAKKDLLLAFNQEIKKNPNLIINSEDFDKI